MCADRGRVEEDKVSSVLAMYLIPAASRLDVVPISLKLHLPAAKPAYQVPVDITTAVVVWLGWAWIVYKIAQVVRRNQGKVKTQ